MVEAVREGRDNTEDIHLDNAALDKSVDTGSIRTSSNTRTISNTSSFLSRFSGSSGHSSGGGSMRVPEMVMGFMSKEGRLVRSWRVRFFVLESVPASLSAKGIGATVLTYYIKQAKNGADPPYGRGERGSLDLSGYTVRTEGSERTGFLLRNKKLILRLDPPADKHDGRVLRLAFDTDASREMWRDALNDHILFANSNHHTHHHNSHATRQLSRLTEQPDESGSGSGATMLW